MSLKGPLLAGIEAGGTKYVCAVARSPAEILMETRFPTGNPEDTMRQAAAFFREATERHGPVGALGIGTFGPADVQPRSATYGRILTTPKAGWAGFNVLAALREVLGASVPIVFETDVNAAAVGEAVFGAGKLYRSLAYVTVGTGIGAGFVQGGEVLHGRMHPEVGHMMMPDLEQGAENNTNVCPFHASCLEGRASGPAIERRWGRPCGELAKDHPAWDLEARYLAHGAVNLTAAWSPGIIIIGGGVLQQPGLIGQVRRHFELLAGKYWDLPPLDLYLRTPVLAQQAGIVGALALAQRLL